MTGNPLYDPYQILMKVYAEKAYLKQAIADTYIEEAYRSRTVKAAYGVLENDAYLSFCISHYAEKSPKLPVRVLLKTALYSRISPWNCAKNSEKAARRGSSTLSFGNSTKKM